MPQTLANLGGTPLWPQSPCLRFTWAAKPSARLSWLGETERAAGPRHGVRGRARMGWRGCPQPPSTGEGASPDDFRCAEKLTHPSSPAKRPLVTSIFTLPLLLSFRLSVLLSYSRSVLVCRLSLFSFSLALPASRYGLFH